MNEEISLNLIVCYYKYKRTKAEFGIGEPIRIRVRLCKLLYRNSIHDTM